MNTTLSTFMKIALTVITIGALLFGTAYTLIENESGDYGDIMDSHRSDSL
ncbi:hypothetical protein [Halobacillus litoralis]|nr:hypothetical protein [Halobacillus litoralis]